MKIYYDKDADTQLIRGKKVAVIGYGSQGHAHSLNLKESGVNVVVGLREGGSWRKAEASGLKVMPSADAVKGADVVILPPSNPVVSVGSILNVPGIREAIASTKAPVVGLSPIVGGAHVRGMAQQLLECIGVPVTADGVALHYGSRTTGGVLDGWLVDSVDEGSVAAVEAGGIACRAVPLMMTDHDATAAMARAAIELVLP